MRANVRTGGYSIRMPRRPRHNQPAAAYHLISRFLEHRWIEAAAAVLGVTPALLRSKRRTNEAVLGRHLVVRCARDLGATLSQIAGALAISEQFACGLGHRDERPEQLGALQGRAFAILARPKLKKVL